MDIRTARVEAHYLIPGIGGRTIGRGQSVDLDDAIAPGVRVRDVFPDEYFEAPAPAPKLRAVRAADAAEDKD